MKRRGSSVFVSSSLRLKKWNCSVRKDDASADDVADDKDTHRLSFTSEQYPLHTSDISCLYIKEKDKDKDLEPEYTPLPQASCRLWWNSPLDVFPLQRYQWDFDKDNDCAEGLICFQRASNQVIPGCIGGEANPKDCDYCILDPLGDGYTDLAISSPTITPLPPKPTVDFF